MNSKYIRNEGESPKGRYDRVEPVSNKYIKSQDTPGRYINWPTEKTNMEEDPNLSVESNEHKISR